MSSAAKIYVDHMKDEVANLYVRREAIEKERDEELTNFAQRLAFVHDRIEQLEEVLAIVARTGVV